MEKRWCSFGRHLPDQRILLARERIRCRRGATVRMKDERGRENRQSIVYWCLGAEVLELTVPGRVKSTQ
ncbi:hypothetical protein SAY87_000290 [Trapa incisa]|uniref:Uncharacterized protein n=1 Tax=Trapa incisa TaxID=236973 RepID=A0AAN7GRF3_9MYRT|nr:hypothetical protein SAY87_000290 [Trapa incisa]